MALPTAQERLKRAESLPDGQADDVGRREHAPAPHPIRQHLTNVLIALSVGCLFFIRRWYDLERLEPRALGYLRGGPVDYTLLIATALSALLVGAACWLAWTWVEKHPTLFRRRFGHVVFLLMMLSSMESVRRYWNSEADHFDWGSNLAMAVLEGLLACGLVLLFFGRLRILMAVRRVAIVLTLLLPGLAFDFTSNVFNAEEPSQFANLPNLPMLPAPRPAPRVIWLVFDELDQRLAFDARPAGLDLPELDELNSGSVTASRATETNAWTAVALPSLISGRAFESARMVSAATLKLQPGGNQPEVEWRKQPNVFASARIIGVNASLVGWHHPYCRIFGDELVRCYALPSSHSTTALEHELLAARVGMVRSMGELFRRAGWNLVDLFRDPTRSVSERNNEAAIQKEQQQQYFALRDHAYADIVDPNLGFVFIHLPTPHMYPIYNRRDRNFDLRGAHDYFDNLALVDRTVGEIRSALAKAGLSEQTAILLTADHGFRPDNWRGHTGWTPEIERMTAGGASFTVPLILKLPRQSTGVRFEGPLSNVIAGDLALAVLKGEIATPDQASQWLGRRVTDRQSATTSIPRALAVR